MVNRIKSRVKMAMAKGFKTTSAGRGSRKGEQGKGRHPGYSGGKRSKAIGVKQAKNAALSRYVGKKARS